MGRDVYVARLAMAKLRSWGGGGIQVFRRRWGLTHTHTHYNQPQVGRKLTEGTQHGFFFNFDHVYLFLHTITFGSKGPDHLICIIHCVQCACNGNVLLNVVHRK